MEPTQVEREREVDEPKPHEAEAHEPQAGGPGLHRLYQIGESGHGPTVEQAVGLMTGFPGERETILARLHYTMGNTFVAEVIAHEAGPVAAGLTRADLSQMDHPEEHAALNEAQQDWGQQIRQESEHERERDHAR